MQTIEKTARHENFLKLAKAGFSAGSRPHLLLMLRNVGGVAKVVKVFDYTD